MTFSTQMMCCMNQLFACLLIVFQIDLFSFFFCLMALYLLSEVWENHFHLRKSMEKTI